MPDQLPPGWTAAPLKDLCDLNPRHPRGTPDDLPVSFVPMAAVSDTDGVIADATVRPFGDVKRGFTQFADADVLWAKITPCMENGKAAVARDLESGLGCGTTEFYVLRSRGAIMPEYLHRYMRQESYRREARATMQSGVGQARVPKGFIQSTAPPLPPLPEQRRIVAKLDALQARSRKARAALDGIPALLDRFRQSVLAAAFRGDLTADWRAAHPDVEPASVLLERIRAERRVRWIEAESEKARGRAEKRAGKAGKPWGPEQDAKALAAGRKKAAGKYKEPAPVDAEAEGLPELPEGWCWSNLGFVAPLLAGHAFSSRGFRTSGCRLLKGNNVRDGWLYEEEIDHWDLDDSDNYERFRLRAGDIVLAMDRPVYSSGSKRTKVVRLPPEWDGALLLQRVGCFRPESELDPSYLSTFVSGHLFRDHLIGRQTGTQDGKDLPHVSAGMVHSCLLPVAPFAEQVRIANLVEGWMAFADSVEGAIPKKRDLAHLDQAILAKAFRGELVPQDPNDEPASELLARIRAEREAAAPAKKARRRRSP